MSAHRNRLRPTAAIASLALACAALAGPAPAARLDPELHAAHGTSPLRGVVTFHGEGPPESGDIALLAAHGLEARPMQALPIALVEASPAQLRRLATAAEVRSVWRDRPLASAARDEAPDTIPHDGSWSGHGIGVLLATPAAGAGSGVQRIAPGAEVVGFRTGSGRSLSTALGAFDHAMSHQFDHNIRVLWNPLAVLDQAVREDPDHPLQVALRALAERGVLVVVPPAADASGSAVPWAITAPSPRDGGAPPLCGVLALMLEANPALDWRDARDILRGHGRDAASVGWVDANHAIRAAELRGGADPAARGRSQSGPLSSFGAQPR